MRCEVNFSEQPPSTQWAAIKYRGEKLAEVWFKPNGEPCTLTFRIPQKSFQISGVSERLTIELLLKAVAIAPEEVESWRHGDASHSGQSGSNPELKTPLAPPPSDVPHLEIFVSLGVAGQKGDSPVEEEERPSACPPALEPPPQAVAPQENSELKIAMVKWQDLEARWNTILGVEVTMNTMRLDMESLRAEIEGWSRRPLTMEERVYALSSDLAQWEKVKNRVHYTVPKMREFVHRVTWMKGRPERKQIEDFFKTPTKSDLPIPEMDKLRDQLEYLLKDLQILSAQGVAAHQEGKRLSAELQSTLRNLQSNSAARARQKMSAARAKGKYV
jgi:hypothetical protein